MTNEIDLNRINQMLFNLEHLEFNTSHHSNVRDFRGGCQMIFVVCGEARFQMGSTVICLKEGDLLAFLSEDIKLLHSQSRYSEYYHLHVSYVSMGNNTEELHFPLQGCFPLHDKAKTHALFENLLNSVGKKEAYEVILQRKLFYELLQIIIEGIQLTEHKSLTNKAIELTIEYINNHYMDLITQDKLAQIAKISSGYYSRLFKQTMNKSPIDYLISVRLDKAKQLLAVPNNRLKEVAESVGFKDEFHFSRTFKKYTGVSPTVFSKSCRESVRSRSTVVLNPFLLEFMVAIDESPIATPVVLDNTWPDFLAEYLIKNKPIRKLPWDDIVVQKNPETLMKLKPDLIIGGQHYMPVFDDLTKVAPTILMDNNKSWQEIFLETAQLFTKEDLAKQKMYEQEQHLIKTANQLNALVGHETFMFINVRPNELKYFSKNEYVYSAMGLVPPACIPEDGFHTLTMEQLIDINPDHIYLIPQITEGLWNAMRSVSQLQQHPLWSKLDAVANHQVYTGDYNLWIQGMGPIARITMHCELLRALSSEHKTII